METFLNLAWVLLALVIVRLWMRYGAQQGATRQQQIAALAMLILILLPVISVTDDLQAAQNPAEYDICSRRDAVAGSLHSMFPAVAMLPPPVFAEIGFSFLGMAAPLRMPVPAVDNPALWAIQNRPPPRA